MIFKVLSTLKNGNYENIPKTLYKKHIYVHIYMYVKIKSEFNYLRETTQRIIKLKFISLLQAQAL